MSDYAPLFTLVVEHGFYDDGLLPGLHFTPSKNTTRLISNCGLLIKPIAGGIMVLQNKKDRESLSLYAADKDDPLKLVFKVYADDVACKSKTDVSIERNGAIPYFDNSKNKTVSDERTRLHDAEYVSMIDVTRLDSNQLMDVIENRERHLPPLFVVNIKIKEQDLQANALPKNYYIKFKERQLFWKYYLVGRMARENLFLVDVDSKTEFVYSGKERLEDQREAMAFCSTKRLPLKASLRYRFQLKEKRNGSEKVIIKRLPVADATRFGHAEIDGRSEVVSEIYINC